MCVLGHEVQCNFYYGLWLKLKKKKPLNKPMGIWDFEPLQNQAGRSHSCHPSCRDCARSSHSKPTGLARFLPKLLCQPPPRPPLCSLSLSPTCSQDKLSGPGPRGCHGPSPHHPIPELMTFPAHGTGGLCALICLQHL